MTAEGATTIREAVAPVVPSGIGWRVEERPRRRTVGMTIGDDGTLLITVPPSAEPQTVAREVRRHEVWICRQHRHWQQTAPDHPVKELVSGEGLLWLGVSHRLWITDDGEPVRLDETGHQRWLYLRRDHAHSADALIDWYMTCGRQVATEHAGRYATRFGIDAPQIKVAYLKRRWASYSPRTSLLTVHWPVFQLWPTLVDFVIGTALLAEIRHVSVSTVYPDHQRLQRDLTDQGRHVWVGDLKCSEDREN